jgi:hypothetical protein
MNVNEFCKMKANDPMENIFPKPTTDSEAWDIITTHVLGENWYSNNPISHDQINSEMLSLMLCMIPSYAYKNKPWYEKVWLHIKVFWKGWILGKTVYICDYY